MYLDLSNSSGVVIASGVRENVKIVAGTKNSISFWVIKVTTGKGSFSVTVNWEEENLVTSVKAGLFDIKGTTAVADFEEEILTVTNKSVVYKKSDVPVGNYILRLSFLDSNGNELKKYGELVVVDAGRESQGNISISDFNKLYTVTYNGMEGVSWKSDYKPLFGRNEKGTFVLPQWNNMDKEGYLFEGWYETSDFSGESVKSYGPEAKNITVYAKWTPGIYASTSSLASLIDTNPSNVRIRITDKYLSAESISKELKRSAGSGLIIDFSMCSVAKEVPIDAFKNCTAVEEFILPDNLEEIKYAAFSNCTNLKRINVPSKVRLIDYYAFNECEKLESISLPEGLQKIGPGAFKGCKSLEKIILPESLESVGAKAFNNCSNLKSIEIKCTKAVLEEAIFLDCVNLESVTLSEGIKTISKAMFSFCSKLKNIYFPDSLEKIENNAFNRCTRLSSINTNKVTEIEYNAFVECTGLKEVTVSDSLKTIGSGAFEGCANINTVKVSSLKEWCEIDFSNSYSNPNYIAQNLVINEVSLPGELVISGIKEVGPLSFYGLSSLTSVSFGDGVEKIDESAFEECSALETVSFSADVKKIGRSAFYKCNGIKNVTVKDANKWGNISFEGWYSNPNFYAKKLIIDSEEPSINVIISDVSEVMSYLFTGCEKLASVSIEEGVTTIFADAFENCTNLQTVKLPSTLSSISLDAFTACRKLEVVEIADVEKWIQISFANAFSNPNYYAEKILMNGAPLSGEIVIKGVKKVGPDLFNGCTEITSVVIEDGVEAICEGAFSNCSALVEITIPESVSEISAFAFMNCEKLAAIKLPSKITEIEIDTFQNCKALTSIEIPEGVTTLNEYSFDGCTNLTEVTIPSTLTLIKYNAFINDNKLSRVNISDVNKWANIKFENRDANPNTHTGKLYLNGNLLSGELNLTGITRVGKYAFFNNQGITKVIIPEGVTLIDDYAFNGCNNVTEISIAGTVKKIGQYAFRGCSKLQSLQFMDSQSKWYKSTNSYAKTGVDVDVSDSEANATMFTSSADADKYWFKKTE